MFFKLKKIRKKIAQNRPEIDEKNSYRKQNVFSSLVKCKKYHPKNTMRLKLSKKAKKKSSRKRFFPIPFRKSRETRNVFVHLGQN
jgi:predicted DNA-binding protein YlxM (UPF0122 family)